MKRSIAARILAVTLAVYIVRDILLTPRVGLETRNVAKVTGVGFATLRLLFLKLLAIAGIPLAVRFRTSSLLGGYEKCQPPKVT